MKTDARISFLSSTNYHLSAAKCLGGGGDDDVGDDNGDDNDDYLWSPYKFLQWGILHFGKISEAVISQHKLWSLKISFIYVSEWVVQKGKFKA